MQKVRLIKTCPICQAVVKKSGVVSDYKAERLRELGGAIVPAMQCKSCQHWGLKLEVLRLGVPPPPSPFIKGTPAVGDAWKFEKEGQKC